MGDPQRANATGRIVNSFNITLNSNRATIPKWVVIIPEIDIIKSINYTEFGVSGAYGMMIEHIMKEMNNSINFFLGNKIPYKANRFNYPNILWIEPSLHVRYSDNDLRMKFIRSLHNAAGAEDKQRVIILPLKQVWNEEQGILVYSNGTLSEQGYSSLTKAIDATIRFADTKLMRNYGIPITQIFQKEKLKKEMLTRLEKSKHTAQNTARDVRTMMQQQQMRQQYLQIRQFFENRRSNNYGAEQQQNNRRPHQYSRGRRQTNPGCSHKSSCKRNLFGKK